MPFLSLCLLRDARYNRLSVIGLSRAQQTRFARDRQVREAKVVANDRQRVDKAGGPVGWVPDELLNFACANSLGEHAPIRRISFSSGGQYALINP